MIYLFRNLSILGVFALLTLVCHSASNQCYYSGDHYLGLGSNYTLDSMVMIHHRSQEPTLRVRFMYQINRDSIVGTYKATYPAESVDSGRFLTGIIEDNVLILTNTSSSDPDVLFRNWIYLNAKHKIDSIVETRIPSLTEFERKTIFKSYDSSQVAYTHTPGSPIQKDSIAYNPNGLVIYSISNETIQGSDTCISLDTICVCRGDSRDSTWEYQVVKDQLFHSHQFIDDFEEDVWYFWSGKSSSISRSRSNKQVFKTATNTKHFTLNGRQTDRSPGHVNGLYFSR